MQSELNEKGDNDAVIDSLNRVREVETKVTTLETISAQTAASTSSICTTVGAWYEP